MTVNFRLATVDDLDTLTAMEAASFPAEKYHQTPRRQFRYLIQKGNAQIWLAEKGGIVCGSIIILFRNNSSYGRMYSINVLPEYQGGVIGKALFEKAEACCKDKDGAGMLLEIRSDNIKHLERYKAQGYMIVKRVEDYYPDGQSCIKLRRKF